MLQRLTERPRELRWYHAAGLLFGDWGTSRLYVLGIAFALSGHVSFWYVAAMCVLVAMVGFSYTIVCAHFPGGGGVYSVAGKRSRNLAVIGALLLIADYVITAALSAYAGFRYILPDHVDSRYAMYAAVVAIVGIGLLNCYGPRRAGFLALVIGLICMVLYAVIGAACLPTLEQASIQAPREETKVLWSQFVNVILALSGVEAIANMTGLMAEPVAKNARRAIFVVLAEVIVLNLVMAWSINALTQHKGLDLQNFNPSYWSKSTLSELPEEVRDLRLKQKEDVQDHMVKILAHQHLGEGFAWVASIFFGILLLSAANTAIGDMVSTQYLMARDREIPSAFTKLNRFGMPWLGLVTATLAPVIVLFVVGNNMELLADLYAIGVVGAITINLLACGTNRALGLKRWEHVTLVTVGVVVAAIWVTIALNKPSALLFAAIVIGLGLLARHAVKSAKGRIGAVTMAISERMEATASALRASIPMNIPRLLVPVRGGNPRLMKFAVAYAKDRGAAMYALYVREVSLSFRDGRGVGSEDMTLENDAEARKILEDARATAEEQGVPFVPIYIVHDSPAEMILDQAATLGVDAVLMGVSQRGALWKTLRGDIIDEVMRHMPQHIAMLIHA